MQKRFLISQIFLGSFFIAGAVQAETVFTDDFETPEVLSEDSGAIGTSKAVDTGKWVRSTQGYRASFNGIENEGAGTFTDLAGEQAYVFRYTNSGVTSAPGVIGTLTVDQKISVSFDVVLDGFNSGGPWRAKLVVFDDEAARNDTRNNTGSTVLAELNGTTEISTYQRVSFEYDVDPVDDLLNLGKDIALRFVGGTNSATIDNVEIEITGGGTPPSSASPEVISVARSGSTVAVGFKGADGVTYILSKSTTLDFTDATTEGTITLSGVDTGLLEDLSAIEPTAFYRIEEQE